MVQKGYPAAVYEVVDNDNKKNRCLGLQAKATSFRDKVIPAVGYIERE